MYMYVSVAESLYFPPEIITALLICYTQYKIKLKKNQCVQKSDWKAVFK